MGQFQIYSKQNMDYTLVSNCFIDYYLTDANDAQIKVYLYLLRCMNSNQGTSVSALADHFNYTEKDVSRALNYWAKKKILELEYTDDKKISGVKICGLETLNLSQELPLPTAVTEPSVISLAASESSDPIPAKLPDLPRTPVKPDYSLDALAEFRSREQTAELVFIAESYLGKTLSSSDIRSLLYISDQLHFSFDLLDYLLQYCVDRGKKDFRYIEKVAISWHEQGITTPEEAGTQNARYDKQVYSVMNALGKSSTPTDKEVEYIKRWYYIYGFTSDVIREACERTVLATDRNRFNYADKILSSWKDAGVHHKTDIAKLDETRSGKKAASFSDSKNKFLFANQRDYDFEALEKKLLQK